MIDIAVSHPAKPGVFVAGILCDGPNYWSAEDARDRDRLRTQILEGLGWSLIRVWAPEWFCSPHECERRLLEKIDAARNPPKVVPKQEPVRTAPAPFQRTRNTKTVDSTVEGISEDVFEPIEDTAQPIDDETRDLWVEKRPEQLPVTSIDAGFREYVTATGGTLAHFNQYSSVHNADIATAILEIVAIEGPLSENTLYVRIKELGRVPRMTPAIKNNISQLVRDLEHQGQVERDDEGFISIPRCRLFPRIRGPKWDIADVSLSEILLAAELILARQHATPKTDLARQTASLLGFKAMVNVRDRCIRAIDMGIRFGMIAEENGLCIIKS